MKNWLAAPDYAGVVWAMVDVDVTRLMGKAEKSMLRFLLYLINLIDKFVAAHPEYGSHSGLLSRVADDKVISQEKRLASQEALLKIIIYR